MVGGGGWVPSSCTAGALKRSCGGCTACSSCSHLTLCPFVNALCHGGVQGIVAAIQHLIARAALDPFVGVFAVHFGQNALLCSELLVPLTRQLLAGVYVAGAGLGNGQLAQQQVFGVVYAHQPQLDAVFDLATTVADFLQAAGAHNVAVVVVVAFDGAQAGDARLGAAQPVDALGLV